MADNLHPDEETKKLISLRALIENGAEIAGGAVGGALGLYAAGPVGAAAVGAGGAFAGLTLKQVGEDIAQRWLGPREKVRVGGVLALSGARIKERIEAGEQIRDDGFFEAPTGHRSDGEEVAESILLKAQREAEEKKLPYMANLLSNIAFDKSINGQLAHQIVNAAEALTYRQLCLFFLFSIKDKSFMRCRNYRETKSFPPDLMQLLYEAYDLYNRGFVDNGREVAFGPSDVIPGKMVIQGLGAYLFNLMNLRTIPETELAPLISIFAKDL